MADILDKESHSITIPKISTDLYFRALAVKAQLRAKTWLDLFVIFIDASEKAMEGNEDKGIKEVAESLMERYERRKKEVNK